MKLFNYKDGLFLYNLDFFHILKDHGIFLWIYTNEMNVFVEIIFSHHLFKQHVFCGSLWDWGHKQYIKKKNLSSGAHSLISKKG